MCRERMRKLARRRWQRRGAVIVQVAVLATVIMGFGALAVDMGMLYSSKAELQAACDSAALAAAAQLGAETGDPTEQARQAAIVYAARHKVAGDAAQLDASRDVEFGRAVFDGVTGKFAFQPSAYNHDAVRVTVRRTADSPGGPIPLMFANCLGMGQKDMWARATAVLIPRDIAVVIDISNSMSYDSELRFWDRPDGGNSNLRDVWAALNGPEPEHPYIPGPESSTEYAGDMGPVYGQMNTWGDPLIPGVYVVDDDPGLAYLPPGSKWSSTLNPTNVLTVWPETPADGMLINQGYDVWERWAVLTNECEGYLTAARADGLGFTTRVIWKEGVSRSRNQVTVYVTSDGSSGTPALSNIQIALPGSAISTALSTATSQYGHPATSIYPDPVTGLVGIKFEDTTTGEDGVSETEWFSFEVPVGSGITGTTVACKAGPGWSSANHVFQKADKGNTTRWQRRVATVLGLGTWLSGMGGEPQGDGDGLIDSENEVAWLAPPAYASGWTWKDYLASVASSGSSGPTATGFRYYYGPKTLADFMLQHESHITQTNNLWATPAEPLRAVKDAVQTMVDVITALDSLDHMSLEVFATTARHQIDLTDDLQSVPDTLYQRQANHWDNSTCLGGGLATAINELQSAHARSAAAKVIVLMSDGVPNVDEDGRVVSTGAASAVQYAYDQADRAADLGIRIYCVSVGYQVDRDVMQTIAAKGHGQEFFASGSPEEYTQELEDIFRALGGKRPVELIE
jgi:Flp pilus assembly protein TadG